MHQAGHFQVSNLCGPPYACGSNPHQKGFVGTGVDFLFRPAKKNKRGILKECPLKNSSTYNSPI